MTELELLREIDHAVLALMIVAFLSMLLGVVTIYDTSAIRAELRKLNPSPASPTKEKE